MEPHTQHTSKYWSLTIGNLLTMAAVGGSLIVYYGKLESELGADKEMRDKYIPIIETLKDSNNILAGRVNSLQYTVEESRDRIKHLADEVDTLQRNLDVLQYIVNSDKTIPSPRSPAPRP